MKILELLGMVPKQVAPAVTGALTTKESVMEVQNVSANVIERKRTVPVVARNGHHEGLFSEAAPKEGASFRVTLENKIKMGAHKGLTMEIVSVTPLMAEVMLERNIRNRRQRPYSVDKLVGEIKSGRWFVTHQGVAFSRAGVLIDGQHRLSAIVKAGMPARMPVFFGVPDDAFPVIDTGGAGGRNVSDVFGIAGEVHASLLAAATRLLWNLESDRLRSNQVGTASEMLEFLDRHSRLRECCAPSSHLAHALKVPPTGIAVALYYISKKYDHKTIGPWLEQLSSGLNYTHNKIPGYVLRKKLISMSEKARVDRRVRSLSNNEIAALFIKAWNAHVKHKTMITLVWLSTEPFPEVQ